MPRVRTTTAAPAPDADEGPLKRLGGGRWQTRDERFTIEPQSGTWVVVDAEQTDDLGLPLVRGPYRSLTDAKAAIGTARSSAPAASPLAERLAEREARRDAEPPARDDEPPDDEDRPTSKTPGPRARPDSTAARGGKKPRRAAKAERDAEDAERGSKAARGKAARSAPPEPAEPGWLTDLEPAERGRARRLIARLEEAGVDDATAVVRRDILGDVPAVATIAISRRLTELPEDATVATVAELLADGRDDRFDVRWRLVDGEGRPIVIEAKRLRSR